MKCPKCNYENTIGSTFCRNCGGSLVLEKKEVVEEIEIMDDFDIVEDKVSDNTEVMDFTISMPKVDKPVYDYNVESSPVKENVVSGADFYSAPNIPNPVSEFSNQTGAESLKKGNDARSLTIVELVKVAANTLIKPMTTFKEYSNDFKNMKNSVTLAVIFSLLLSLNFLVIDIFNKIFVKEVNFFGPSETKFVLENIKNANFLSFIYVFLGSMIGFMAIASIFYIGGLIAKKTIDFAKMISVVVLSFSPMIIGMVLSSLLFFLPYYFMMGILAVSCIYFVVLLIHFINHDVVFSSENGSIYYMLGCYGTISVLMTIIGAILVQIYIVNPLKDLFPF